MHLCIPIPHPCLSLWERCPVRTLGGEGERHYPLSQPVRLTALPKGEPSRGEHRSSANPPPGGGDGTPLYTYCRGRPPDDPKQNRRSMRRFCYMRVRCGRLHFCEIVFCSIDIWPVPTSVPDAFTAQRTLPRPKQVSTRKTLYFSEIVRFAHGEISALPK